MNASASEPFLDIEPDPEPPLRMVLADDPVSAAPPPPAEAGPALMRILPSDFPLATLLSFLPDVRLKQRADNLAEIAASIDVAVPGGLARADATLDDLRAVVKEGEECFEYPCSVAFQLHKRLTGLRADFLKNANGAIAVLGRRVVDETRRREREQEAERRRLQEEADRRAREAARQAAEEAKRQQAPVGVQQILDQQAEMAQAPPVALPVAEPLRTTAIAAKWRARPVGTVEGAPSNPSIDSLTEAQRTNVLRLVDAVASGRVPLAAIEINWSYLNKRAAAEKTALDIPGIEAIDEGSPRRKK